MTTIGTMRALDKKRGAVRVEELYEGYSKGSVWSRLVNACGLSM